MVHSSNGILLSQVSLYFSFEFYLERGLMREDIIDEILKKKYILFL